ncbi:armadillo-like helical domain-containing protein 4 isoform X2 [Syngnathoides biaculeatus]|uniref:armadillo-like helical domain-containing protein 4 isoform X2 n=1 Tax=Syngnathoides biaculeatus TaxID=300417 RepID=UPI002ADE4D15|nr:armadillo-like helical domain-containing protein 4 isoform X2 [Syngnathoides biaculeatus]
MLTSDAFHRLLLAGVCMCVCGNAVQEIEKGAAASLGRRPRRMLVQNRESPDAEPKRFWRTPRDTMDDIGTGLSEDATWSSSPGVLNPSSGGIPTPVSRQSRTSTVWEREDPVVPTPPEPFLPDMGVDSMPKEDSVESLWTEAPGPSGANTAAPPSPDDSTEGTMSSESLPLIFEPLEESAVQSPFATETDGPPPDLEHPDASRESGFGTAQTSGFKNTPQAPADEIQWGPEEKDFEDDPDRDENSEESPEDEESDEDTTETSRTEPPYSFVPPPPVWVQRNQGLMRSWVALIREKVSRTAAPDRPCPRLGVSLFATRLPPFPAVQAGYVSGMLAPVGVGMAGALLLVGALYSVRRIQRRRSDGFKRQRRKVRPAEQPGETCVGRQDQAMLLADSSEDEF